MSKKRKQLDAFFAGSDELDSFFNPPSDPPPRPIVPNWFDKRTVEHGKILQHRETHQFKMIRVEKYYEDGYIDWMVDLDRRKYEDGLIVVDGVRYENCAHYYDKEKGPEEVNKNSGPRVATTETTVHGSAGKYRNKNRDTSQEEDTKYRPPNDLHPYLVGDFLIVEAEYEWPKLPTLNADPGEQRGLFEGEYEINVRRNQKRANDRESRRNADPLAGFFGRSDRD